MLKKGFVWFEKHYIISLLIAILTAILTAILIFYLSSIPSSGYPSGLGVSTKIYHLFVFSFLALFLIISIIKGKQDKKYFIFIALLIAIIYGASDEMHQFFVPGRNPALNDVMIDSIGVMIAGIIYSIRMRFTPHQKLF